MRDYDCKHTCPVCHTVSTHVPPCQDEQKEMPMVCARCEREEAERPVGEPRAAA